MSSAFYLPRRLSSNGKTYSETELLALSDHVVVLAEPGGGKTELMKSLAYQLDTSLVTASVFRHSGTKEKNIPLVIDAFDELAKMEASGIYKLLSQAKEANPTHVYLSSRSSEWDDAATSIFNEFFGHRPLVVRLCEFNKAEQHAIFDHHVQGEDFEAFQAEVTRFGLEMLLPNPQFLKLFADAYLESEKHFTNKRSIFKQATERLAKEVNPNLTRSDPALSTIQKVDISSEVFTKLLLSGAEGVCTRESTANRMYPLLAALFYGGTAVDGILSTRVFKPGDSADQHRSVHKIVAEYCAADYLTSRIANPADPLTLPKCLAIIAPNSTVRDELRGLLGWMAALGNRPIEVSAIELDPYAVLANGDPSQLQKSSKRLLINRLKDIEKIDPYFRRGDFWRRFSVAGFFTPEVVEEIKPLLVTEGDGHLRNLILELLDGSPAIEHLKKELREIVMSQGEKENTRLLANRCLLDILDDYHRSELDDLISEASNASLHIAAMRIEALGPERFDRDYLAKFFRACATLYLSHQKRHESVIGERYFIKPFIAELNLITTKWLLDDLTEDFECICDKKFFECECRTGMSKIVGSILDRYFELATPPFDPLQVWQWVGNLNFHNRKTADQSKAVQVLQEDDSLRQSILAHVFGELNDRDEIFETQLNKFGDYSHSGLNFHSDDIQFIVDLAFETDNPDLWVSFMARHQHYRNKEDRGPNALRRRMRKQALEKPAFMREWAITNRRIKKQNERDNRMWRDRHSRKKQRHRRKQEKIRNANIKYVQDNWALVESGRDWICLMSFAELVLESPDKIEQEFGDEMLVRNSLKNCLDFIAPEIPDLRKLAELRCASKYRHSEKILFAACLEIMRVKGSLAEVDLRLLQALRTKINMGYRSVSEVQRNALKTEVNRLIFSDDQSIENFLRQYVEPQLEKSECNHPELWLLCSEDAFSRLRSKLTMEWLKRFPELSLEPLDTLFEIAAQYGDREKLKEIITEHCAYFMSEWPNPTGEEDVESKRKFWFLRAWYFLDEGTETYWDWLKADKNTVLRLNERSGQMNYGEHSYWPKLSSDKIEAILDTFIDKWPKVDLPSHWGSGSPIKETAYRFLTEIIRSINSDNPDDAIPVLDRLLDDSRFADLHKALKNIHARQVRKKALRDFEPPTPQEIVNLIDRDSVVTVESLRQLVIQELQDFQKTIDGGEFNTIDRFYEKGERLGEVRSTEIIAERLNLRLEPKDISITPEHQLKSANRSDFTVTKMIGGKKRLLVTEVKGQWHNELYTAASTQLHERYSIHPDAEQQGIFIVIWFGSNYNVAGRSKHGIRSAQELKTSVEARLPAELRGLIDVFVLDVTKT